MMSLLLTPTQKDTRSLEIESNSVRQSLHTRNIQVEVHRIANTNLTPMLEDFYAVCKTNAVLQYTHALGESSLSLHLFFW